MRKSSTRLAAWAAFIVLLVAANLAPAADPKPEDLRLIPFPKELTLAPGTMALGAGMHITVSDSPAAKVAAADLREDFIKVVGAIGEVQVAPADGAQSSWSLVLSQNKVGSDAVKAALDALPKQDEGYALVVTKDFAAVGAGQATGLARGVQCLRQLIRANVHGQSLACLAVRDWPTLRYRGFQDDITRGQSPRPETLQLEARMTALLRMNFLTYYMEHQYEFRKHPDIGPAGGTLLQAELQALVAYAKGRDVEIIGSQQSFGHFWGILQHKPYMALQEAPGVLDPTNEGTYKLLDEMYSEQVPLLESKFFNVCCDEVGGLGTGPSKPVADKIGPAALYARHIKRLHDMLKDKYGKRMMMWGDIVLQNPSVLNEIPKDTIMLSWGYGPGESMVGAITPFTKAGYEFFVCPGVNCWGRILPGFGDATVNIKNYVRDGAKLGALGMLNTTWDDDGEDLFGSNWHGIAWGAECAWTGSTTTIEDFNRRIGGVLFGEPGDDYGQAITLLTKTHALPGYGFMSTGMFWQLDMARTPVERAWNYQQAKALLEIVEPALDHLRAARKNARFDAEQIDYVIFGAERMKLMASRWIEFCEIAQEYERAWFDGLDATEAGGIVRRSMERLTKVRDEHARLKEQFRQLYLREEKPYALEGVLGRYDSIIARYNELLAKLSKSLDGFKAGTALSAPRQVGLQFAEVVPDDIVRQPLAADLPWAGAAAAGRLGIAVSVADSTRADQPIEVDLPKVPSGGVRLMELDRAAKTQTPVPCQIVTAKEGARLMFLMPGRTAAGAKRTFYLYMSAGAAAAPGTQASALAGVACTDAPGGMKWVQNDKFKLLVGPEGGHIYRWEIKALGNRDITEPGERDWAGFADLGQGPSRKATNRIEVLANGPLLVRLRLTDGTTGVAKTISAYAALPYVEVRLSSPGSSFLCYDDTSVMGAASATPGSYLFSDGESGKVRPQDPLRESQAIRPNVFWSAKYVSKGPLLAMVTPEAANRHVVGPGGGMVGVGIDGGNEASHYIIYGGLCPASVKDTLDSLRATYDSTHLPAVTLYAMEQTK